MPLSTIDNTGLSQSQILSAINMPTGSVVQFVQGPTTTSNTSTNGTTFVATNITATITPQFSTSKILIFVNTLTWMSTAASNYTVLTIYRGATNLGSGSQSAVTLIGAPPNSTDWNTSFQFLDSPATTNSTTYTVYVKAYSGGGNSANVVDGASPSFMTLMEIR